jgi:hypothetical protein
MADGDFVGGVIRLLQAALVLYPPYYAEAAFIFIPLKIISVIAGIWLAVAVYPRVEKRADALLSWRFLANLVLLIVCIIAYNVLFYRIDSPTEVQKIIFYVVYCYINGSFAFLLVFIVFRAPLEKVKEWISWFRSGGADNKG